MKWWSKKQYFLGILGVAIAIGMGLVFLPSEEGQNGNTGTPRSDDTPPPASTPQEILASRIDIINVALAHQDTLLPVSAPGSIPIRFWFSSASEFYMEYKRSQVASAEGMIFAVAREPADSELFIERKSLYRAGENDWILIEGEEVRFTKPQRELYEKNAAGTWIRIN